MSRIYKAICKAIEDGKLKEEFNAEDCRRTIEGFAKSTFSTFLPKHRKGRPGSVKYTEYFVRCSRGRYKLL